MSPLNEEITERFLEDLVSKAVDRLENALKQIALMWAFSLVGAAATVYDTVRDPIDGLLKRFKG